MLFLCVLERRFFFVSLPCPCSVARCLQSAVARQSGKGCDPRFAPAHSLSTVVVTSRTHRTGMRQVVSAPDTRHYNQLKVSTLQELRAVRCSVPTTATPVAPECEAGLHFRFAGRKQACQTSGTRVPPSGCFTTTSQRLHLHHRAVLTSEV